MGYWSHIYHKHAEILEEDRLKEIQRTAILWSTYWSQGPDGGKGASTLAKLATAGSDTFCWEDVKGWNLRR